MADLNEVYRKYGEASEAAQLLENELGNLLIEAKCIDGGEATVSPEEATIEVNRINRSTLGRLITGARDYSKPVDELSGILEKALGERNRLAHHFFRQHNNRRNSAAGCAEMLADLEGIHSTIIGAFERFCSCRV